MNHRVAALDCGTNSLRLLVADVTPDGQLVDVRREMAIVRLGQDVDRTGRLGAAALERTEAALRGFVAMIDDAAVDAVRMVATSAVRDAANADEFRDLVERVLGRSADVLTGAAEAQLSFVGAVAGTTGAGSGGAPVVVDIGGGSTEVIRGDRRSLAVDLDRSLDVGSVRLTERHVGHDPPTGGEVAAIEDDVLTAWRDAGLEALRTTELIGVAGTVTTVAAMALDLDRYDSARIHGAVLARDDVERTVGRLLAMDRAERSACPVIHPGRVDVIAAGGMIMRAVVRRVGADRMLISEHDILDGVARSLIGPGAPAVASEVGDGAG